MEPLPACVNVKDASEFVCRAGRPKKAAAAAGHLAVTLISPILSRTI
jgi:hypothetical protein